MQIKKDIPLFIVLALVSAWLIVNGRCTPPASCIGSCLKENPASKTGQKVMRGGGSSKLNFITRSIFHIPS